MYNWKSYISRGPSHKDIKKKYKNHPRYYFAYGSNLNLKQMETRCPTATLIGAAELEGFKLVFRGVLDIERARANSKVVGAIFKVNSWDIYKLDCYEGYPTFYNKETTIAKVDNQNVKLFYYIMNNQEDVKPPSEFYYSSCEQGYKDCGLPIQRLKQAYYNSINRKNTDIVDCGAKWGINTRNKIINIPKNNISYKFDDNDDDFNQETLFDDLRPYGNNNIKGGK
tara:strand:+ start:1838 stop:2512 length:675 start_codon:yes stop_codon:yes gene_type:complete